MIARQACAEGRTDDVRAIFDQYFDLNQVGANSANPMWLILKMLGEEEQALKILKNYEFDDVPFAIAAWLSYPTFDPAPFPALMAILKRENVNRRPTATLPYACTQSAN
jgi:hypothetical protein